MIYFIHSDKFQSYMKNVVKSIDKYEKKFGVKYVQYREYGYYSSSSSDEE